MSFSITIKPFAFLIMVFFPYFQMQSTICIGSLTLLWLTLVASQTAEDVLPLVTVNAGFASRLYLKLTDGSNGNVFFSPHSVSTVLAMTYMGAATSTKADMSHTLGLGSITDDTDLGNMYSDLGSILRRRDQGYTLVEANKLYAQDGQNFISDFITTIEEDFNSGLEDVDFGDSTTRDDINDWVSRTTQNKINDLVKPGDIDETTRLVIVNAVYFNALWTLPFNPNETKVEPFHLTDVSRVDVPMMNKRGSYVKARSKSLGCEILQIPYGEESDDEPKASFIILKPSNSETLTSVEQKLSTVNLVDELELYLGDEPQKYLMDISLPTFKITHQQSLKEPLEAMGMRVPFTEDADFSKIESTSSLFIGDVIHQAFVEVNEKGK